MSDTEGQFDLSWSRNSPLFMEPEGSLPRSQEPAIGPYPAVKNAWRYTSALPVRHGVVLS